MAQHRRTPEERWLSISPQRAPALSLEEALSNIVMNARIQPDASMRGATDTYAVPLDDIEAASKALKAAAS